MTETQPSLNNYREEENSEQQAAQTENPTNDSFFCPDKVSISKKSLTPLQVVLSLCRAKNWFLSDLATAIGIQRQSLNHYLHGRWVIPSRIKILIAEKLGVDSSVIWDLEMRK